MSGDAPSIEILKRILDAFNAHDVDAVMRFFADDCTLEMPRGPHPYGQRFRGRSAVADAFGSRFRNIPDVRYVDDSHFVAGDIGVSRWTLRGTSLSGERIDVRGCDFFEFREGKVVRKDSYWKIVE